MHRLFRIVLAVVGSTVAFSVAVTGVADARPSTAAAPPVCTDVLLPVSSGPDAPPVERMYGRYCAPAGGSRSVQVLVPGVTYDHTYWDLPTTPETRDGENSYVRAATAAGQATLAVDRVGIGRSSKPVGLLIDEETGAHALHQAVAALRSGGNGLPAHAEVTAVGHSYGSIVVWKEASRYRDVDRVVLTGVSHRVNPVGISRLFASLVPAPADRGLTPPVSDPTYLTTRPGTRRAVFHDPGDVPESLVAYDEKTKKTLTVGELRAVRYQTLGNADVRVPVLLVQGSADPLFCGTASVDCSTPEALVRSEGPRLGADVPSIDARIVPGAGHDLTYVRGADAWFATTQEWIATTPGRPR